MVFPHGLTEPLSIGPLLHGLFSHDARDAGRISVVSSSEVGCNWLVVEPYSSEKYDKSSVGMMNFPTEWKNKTCSKLPISYIMLYTL